MRESIAILSRGKNIVQMRGRAPDNDDDDVYRARKSEESINER